ncbi:MAG: MarR family transcriptional regulator [Chloroflexales bacterium]|nr:MarR family transcriptional regulator [Chloroflexales bacterium]
MNAPAASGERIGALIRELTHVVVQRSAGEMLCVMSEAGLSMPQLVALNRLQSHGTLSISAIAAALNLSLAATSHLVERLVRQGLVARSEDQQDRRHKCVALTPHGEALVERLVQARVREIDNAVAILPATQRQQLEGVLDTVLDALHRKHA